MPHNFIYLLSLYLQFDCKMVHFSLISPLSLNVFAFSQEMLSRSSLETQKLELMSAMSELKLQQAALERENLELRTTYFNNNSIPPERRPPVPGRMRTNSTSALHGSHNSLQNSSGTIPKVYMLDFNNEFYIYSLFNFN